jgi:tetratricopeptide (TPR) repeat protein
MNPQLQQAVTLHRAGRLEDAVRAYKTVLRDDERAVGVLNLLGLAQFQLGQLPEAIDALGRVAHFDPNFPNIDFHLGQVLQAQGRLEDALDRYEKAVARAPQDAGALTGLGTVLAAMKRYDEAVAVYRRAATIDPRSGELWHNLGNALQSAEQYDEATAAYQRELELRPDHVPALDSLCRMLFREGRHKEAIEVGKRLIALEPDNPEHPSNLANALSFLGRDEEALAAYDRAAALDPASVFPLYDKGIFHLSRGDFAEGWRGFRHRWEVKGFASKLQKYPQPLWTGQHVDGTLLVWREQGLGDQILMSSLIPDLVSYADHVVLEVDPRLVSLLQRSFPGVSVVPQTQQPYSGPIAAHCPLGDLPQYLRPDARSFENAGAGYLHVNQETAHALRRRLTADGRRIVGLSWSSVHPEHRRSKSARLADFAPLLRLANCRFIDLQYGDTRQERDEAAREAGLVVEHVDDIDNTNDIDGLAALMAACDAVVTISNTNAHLAAAQGKPTFVLLSDGAGLIWYWMKRGSSTPFYASARLFRQGTGQPWSDLVATTVVPAVVDHLRHDPDTPASSLTPSSVSANVRA